MQSPFLSRPARDRARVIAGALLLAAGTLAVYAPACTFDFISLDDPDYVSENPHVRRGVTLAGLRWAATTSHACNWHPLTWVSHMIDCQAFGVSPGAHHAISVLLHAVNTVVLFLALRALPGGTGRSFLAAGFFAVHPLHVESVAWIAERKDVLCALFFLLAVRAHLSVARRQSLVALLFLGALLAKPMAVTLPLVLLLLDVWPLRRIEVPSSLDADAIRRVFRQAAAPVAEKLPLLLLTLLCSAITFLAQRSGGAVIALDSIPLDARLRRAPVAYVWYLAKLAWPNALALPYPHPVDFPSWRVAASAALLLLVTVWALLRVRDRPCLLVGWLWFVGMLVPVIGLVQVGPQLVADRYVYLPSIGIFVMLGWGIGAGVAGDRLRRRLLATTAVVLLLACTVATRRQLASWRDSRALFEHTLAVTGANYLAEQYLGSDLLKRGDLRGAEARLTASLALAPEYSRAHAGMGLLRMQQGRAAAAIEHYRRALKSAPRDTPTLNNLGLALAGSGRFDEAAACYRQALAIDPDMVEAYNNLGGALTAVGRHREAAAHFREALARQPDLADVHVNLAISLQVLGMAKDAEASFREALRTDPDHLGALNRLGLLLSQEHRDAEARVLFTASLRQAPADPLVHRYLADIMARSGETGQAVEHYREAMRLDPGSSETAEALARLLAASTDRGVAGPP